MASINFPKENIQCYSDNPHFLLTNGNADYLALGNPNSSNYDGFFIRSAQGYYKVLANIASAFPTTALEIGEGVLREAGGSQRFSLLDDGVRMEGTGEFTITLDCKKLYDESDVGRIYAFDVERSGEVSYLHVVYKKYADAQLTASSYELHVCIASTLALLPLGNWRNICYDYDARRGTKSTLWVYDAAAVTGTGAVALAAGADREDARRKAALVLNSPPAELPPSHLPARANIALQSLLSLRTKRGIMAGLPWFFQEWSRDELISCGGLLAAGEYDAVISIIDKWYDCIQQDGTLPAIYPSLGLPSSDAPGWLGKRTLDVLTCLSGAGMQRLPQHKLVAWRERTGVLIDSCVARLRNDLIWSEKNTTWADTSLYDDGRAGARIEIQALYLALFEAHERLSTLTKTSVNRDRASLFQRVRVAVKSLVSDGMLLDGLHEDGTPDLVVRPNIFLAWYAYPSLFTKQEWAVFFRSALPRLWLHWGGLASIDVQDERFRSYYTGEDIASYHRGDSWYFVNNIAAMAMHATDPTLYHPRSIVRASVYDMLSLGYIGHCSEISSALSQEPCGTHAQAWSASTLIEALLKIDID